MDDSIRGTLPSLPLWLHSGRTPEQRRSGGFGRRIALVMMLLLAMVQALSLFGYAFFVRNPANLSRYPWAQPIFTVSYPLFAQLEIVIAFLAMAFYLTARTGLRWLPAFIVSFAVSLGSELAGTTFGFPFGAYSYNGLLGVKVLDQVPWLIPISWFFMSLASYGIVYRWIGHAGFSFRRILLGSWLLVTWDLTLDPAMSHLTPFWVWGDNGGWGALGSASYFGMPLLNIGGWLVTGVAILFTFELVRVRTWLGRVPFGFFAIFYLLNLILPAGIVLIAGLWEPWLVMCASYLALLAMLMLLGRNRESGAAFLHAARSGHWP